MVESLRKQRLVLAGGGHAHVLVLKAFAERPEPNLDLVLVAKDLRTPYSGMLPGHVAGLYPRAALEIDLARLAQRAGARLVHDEAVRFDAPGRQVLLRNAPPEPYDVLSIDIGITPDLSGIHGAAEHALAVKPIGDFLAKWERLRDAVQAPAGPRRIAIVGGGPAGLCLSFAVAASLRRDAEERGRDPAAVTITLVSGGRSLELNAGMRRAALRALRRHGIALVAGAHARAIDAESVTLTDGRRIPADAVMVATQAAPPPALRDASLTKDRHGFLAIRPTLQVVGSDSVFAAGDCATMLDHPRPKAGVFAVRQGPHLAANLRLWLRGAPLAEVVPQRAHLILLSTADGRAIGGRGSWLSFEGRLAFRLKDWIDRRFMRQFP